MFVCLQSLTREHWKVNISYSSELFLNVLSYALQKYLKNNE